MGGEVTVGRGTLSTNRARTAASVLTTFAVAIDTYRSCHGLRRRIVPDALSMLTPLALFETFTWWAKLTNAQQFFYGIGIVAGIVTIIMGLFALIGLEHHDADIPHGDHLDGSSLL